MTRNDARTAKKDPPGPSPSTEVKRNQKGRIDPEKIIRDIRNVYLGPNSPNSMKLIPNPSRGAVSGS
ncbi:MAG: hypothetical protein V3W28_04195 [Thermoplasmata archaeon]